MLEGGSAGWLLLVWVVVVLLMFVVMLFRVWLGLVFWITWVLTLWMTCLGLCVGGLGFGGDSVVWLLVGCVMLIVLF